ncbi:unnamed protein product [Prorocentrum cordatum]|uniref:Uncharacterized protein n=1 Tax=Prorocentrum cordatum TaxID=2364126 RepID=A0ABN9Q9E7_9DINO|nr:unnamed protein product [Polarella glacialis]
MCSGPSEDFFGRWPCPGCRPRGPGGLAEAQLAGCCALRACGRQPPWRAECGRACTDEEVRGAGGGEALAREALRRFVGVSGAGAAGGAAARNAFLAEVLRALGEDHSASQLLLRGVALRAVRAAQPLERTAEAVWRCHGFLVRAGWPLGMMPLHGLYGALIERAQAELAAHAAGAPWPASWPSVVAAAAHCAAVLEGPDSARARRGALCSLLCAREGAPPCVA